MKWGLDENSIFRNGKGGEGCRTESRLTLLTLLGCFSDALGCGCTVLRYMLHIVGNDTVANRIVLFAARVAETSRAAVTGFGDRRPRSRSGGGGA